MNIIQSVFMFIGALVFLVFFGIALRAAGEWLYHWLLDWALVCEYLWHRKQFKEWLRERRKAGRKPYER